MIFTASEILTITGLTPVQSTASLVDNVGGARATSALIVAKTAPVDFTYVDGATPAAGTSIRNAVDVPQLVQGYENIKNAVYFNRDGNPATLYIQYAYS